jgi:hypothetical protein
MIPQCWPIIIVIAAWLCAIFLAFRVSAFRRDRPEHRGYFGVPYVWNWKYFDAENFTREGRPYLYWLWVDTALFAVGGLLAMVLCV